MTEIPVPVLGNPTGVVESPCKQIDGKLRESPVTSAKDARPVQSPLTSSSSMDSPKNKHKDIKKENKVGSDSPSWGGEGRRPTNTHRFDNTPDQESVVPKFGDWDENDPSSGDRYTGIFEKAREEKNSSATKPPMITIEPDFYPSYRSQKSKGFSCFGWLWK